MTTTGTVANDVVWALYVAVIKCDPAVDGGVYSPEEDIVPVVVFPPTTPSTDQVTSVVRIPLMNA